ncbi:MAG: molecular chaperone HtpG [Erysipelotrichaceae bacterium]|nr:molecular chaperone HtpG [Erysipelotrichaceae bacterium]
MSRKQFKTESKKLLDLMINSIYTNREIFLRELISNASDALDKRHFLSLTDSAYTSSNPLSIQLSVDRDKRTLTIEDNGIGMNGEELEKNLGTIAHSGTSEFREQLENSKDVDIIGQFGVGFYSAFMVADSITVESRKVNDDAYRWHSDGQSGYTVEPCDRQTVGTRITLKLREDTDEVKYSEYLDKYTIEQLVKRYSDYIRYPIQMMVDKSVLKEGSEDEYETIETLKTLNTMVPLWRRNKKDIKDEDYNSFYKSQFYDYEDPQEVIHYSLEGNISYKALLYIPSRIPYNYYSRDYEAGLQLYSKGVFIMDRCKELLPDYFHFVKGLVDSDDVSLNISREMLQKDSQLQELGKSVTKRVKNALVNMLVKDREKYEKFYKNFGYSLKYGCYQDYGMHKDELQDLLLFYSSNEDKYVTLKEYKERMKEEQKDIYYATGSSVEQIRKLPQIEKLLDKGYEVLFMTDDIDEFVIMMMREYDGKNFQNAQQADTEIESEEEKQAKEELVKENEDLLKAMGESLGEKVREVRISSRLKSHPVCLVADASGISLDMEKYLSKMPEGAQAMKATKILEINPDHDIFKVLQKVQKDDPEKIGEYADLLYQQALLIEGFTIEDPVEFSNRICRLMKQASGE